MSYLGRKGAAAPINAGDIPDDSITTAKIVVDTILVSDLADEVGIEGSHHKIPSVTTANRPGESGGTNASQTATVGMIIYNTTLGTMQQYNASGWSSIDFPPTISSIDYPGDDTALDTVGEFNLSCTTQSSTTVLASSTTGIVVGHIVKGTGISTVSNLTCGLTNTDATVTVAGSTTGLVVGMTVAEFTGVPAGATILSIITDTSFELSANATATNASAVLSFNTTVSSIITNTSFVIAPTATAGATVTLTFNTQTLIITGINFLVGATVTIDGTAPSTVTRDSSTQITVTGTPAKTAGTKVNGLIVSNTSGFSSNINVDYSALPAWTTASGTVLTAYNSTISTIDLVATGDAPITYAITTGALPTGLSMSTSTGDITGTMSGSAATYNFNVNATDAEAQSSPRLFNIISNGSLPTGGDIIESAEYNGDFRSHTFLADGIFTSYSSLNVDILIVAGGGSGGSFGGGGGGAGGMVTHASYGVTAQAYDITVGAGGAAPGSYELRGVVGGNSIFEGLATVDGGGYGGTNDSPISQATLEGGDGGSGGGTGKDAGSYSALGGTATSGQGSDGGTTVSGSSAGASGGGGKSAAGVGGGGGEVGGDGGAGAVNAYKTGNDITYAGGGGGSTNSASASNGGEGGVGGGGNAALNSQLVEVGTNGLGGGGGGGAYMTNSYGLGGRGGSGIIVIRYAI